MAIADVFVPPEINSIDTANFQVLNGDIVMIRAMDYFKLASKYVQIHDVAERMVEEGNAVLQLNGLDWKWLQQCSLILHESRSLELFPGNCWFLDFRG